MKLDDLKQAVLELSAEDKFSLALEVGPVLCESVMQQPDGMEKMMKRMMPVCGSLMAKHPEMMARMGEMMPAMMKR